MLREAVTTAKKRTQRPPHKQRPKSSDSILAAPLIVGREHKRNKQKETAGRQRQHSGAEGGSVALAIIEKCKPAVK